MTIRTCAMAFTFSLLANAVSAETPPPAANSRQDAALEALVAQVGTDLSQTAVLSDLGAKPGMRLREIQGCIGDFDPHDAREHHDGHSHGPVD